MIPVLKCFSTPDGVQLFKAKSYGETIVPFGCYYDEGERADQITLRLQQDVFPLLYHLKQRIATTFELPAGGLQICSWIEFENENTLHNLKALESACKQRVMTKSPDDFGFFVNFDFIYKRIACGTQLTVLLNYFTWDDEDADTEYPVWFIGVGGVYLNLDCEISMDEIKQVELKVLSDLWRCYTIGSSETGGK